MNVLDHLLSILFFCQKAAAVSTAHGCQRIRAQFSYNYVKLLVHYTTTNMDIPHTETISVSRLPHTCVSQVLELQV